MKKSLNKWFVLLGFGMLGAQIYAAPTRLESSLPEARPVENHSEYRPHLGVFVGMNNPEGSYNTTAEYGLDVGYQPYVPFGLGLEVNSMTTPSTSNSDRLNRVVTLAKATYNFGGDIPVLRDSYVGLGAGAAFQGDATPFAGAALIGFDIPLSRNTTEQASKITAGAVAKYTIVEGRSADTFSLNGLLKYWF